MTMQMLKQGWEQMAQGRFVEVLASLQAGESAKAAGARDCETHE